MNIKELGKLFALNLYLTSETLQDYVVSDDGRDSHETVFAGLSNRDLYSRLMIDVDFDKLSHADKMKFLFLNSTSDMSGRTLKEFYGDSMELLAQEAHNRTCKSLGIKPAKVELCNFRESGCEDNLFSQYSNGKHSILINFEALPKDVRPSLLLENINNMTYIYYIANTLSTMMSAPQELSNFDFFVAMTTAVKSCVFDDMRTLDPQTLQEVVKFEYTSPASIAEELYGIEKTKYDLKSAGLYGGDIQEKLCDYHRQYCDLLSKAAANSSLIYMEDIFGYFEHTPLDINSNGLFSKMVQKLERATASDFYNAIGADMTKGQSVTDYINVIEKELFDEHGIELPPQDEVDGQKETDDDEAYDDDEIYDEDEEVKPGDEPAEDDEETEEGQEVDFYEDMEYKPFRSLFKEEQKIDLGPRPFRDDSQSESVECAQ